MVVYKMIPKKLGTLSGVICVLATIALVLWFRRIGVLLAWYDSLYGVFQWAVFFLWATHIIGLVVIFGKSFTEEEKLLCGLNMLVVLVTPLGSNNQLFSAMNNLYIAAPITMWMLWRFVRRFPGEFQLKKLVLNSIPVKLVICMVILVLAHQSIRFSIRYVFTEATGGKEHTTYVENNDTLKWMKTDEEKAIILSEISEFAIEANLEGKEVLLYGSIPSLSFYLKMPCVLSPWADLRSYNYIVMEEVIRDLQGDIDEKGRECPVIILNRATSITDPADKKGLLIHEMIEKYGYKTAFENDKFLLLMVEG